MKSAKGWLLVGAVIMGLGSLVFIWSPHTSTALQVSGISSTAVRNLPLPPLEPKQTLSQEERRQLLARLPEAHLADELNAPDGTLRQDMGILASLFSAYRSTYSGQGNPIGDNREITDTFLGGGLNRNKVPFLSPQHRAINERGELCDRWGTPFHFHAESGSRMEIRSAGPDKILRTADDMQIIP